MRRILRLFAGLIAAAALVPVASAAADPYPVTTTNESGAGSLRAAILAANSHPGADTVPIQTTGTISLQDPLQVIFDPVSIVGPGADLLTVQRGAAAATGFSIFGFSADASPSSISGLTVSNGRGTLSGMFALGGGVRNGEGSLTLTGVVVRGNEAVAESDTSVRAEGGGVFSEGPLTLRETTVTGNTARASDGATLTAALGGGVAALGELTVEASTISGNVAEASSSGSTATAQGGGLLAGTEATISRSTISGNAVDAGGTATQRRAQGGGVQVQEATITASTLAGNSATSAGLAFGANLVSVLGASVRDTIVAEPLGDADSCDGTVASPGVNTIVSGGYNLDQDGSCEFGEGSDLAAVVAGLGPLADNGGPTPTHALLAGSIAIDRGNSFGTTTDQRGFPRPSDFPAISNKEGGDGSDIGAFELQAPAAPSGGGTPIHVQVLSGDKRAPNTRIVSGPARAGYKRLAKFRFASTEPQSRFQCKVDKAPWRGCRNPFKRKVSAGGGNGRKHLFKVRAIDRFGNVDPSPARFGWRVKKVGD